MVVEATGSSQGIRLALALTRPLGTVVLKSTCSTVSSAVMWRSKWHHRQSHAACPVSSHRMGSVISWQFRERCMRSEPGTAFILPGTVSHKPSAMSARLSAQVGDPNMPSWSEVGNDVVVQEKKIVGSR